MTDAGSKSSAKVNVPEEIEDPVESMLKKTGCTELHYKVQVSHLIKVIAFKMLELSKLFFISRRRSVLLRHKIGESVETSLLIFDSVCQAIQKSSKRNTQILKNNCENLITIEIVDSVD